MMVISRLYLEVRRLVEYSSSVSLTCRQSLSYYVVQHALNRANEDYNSICL